MKLIDKSALVAEIERRTGELWELIPDGEKVFSNKHTKEDTFNLGKYTALESLDKFIDTLEVKELDLDVMQRMEECPYRQVGCTMYEGHILECKGACSWVVDYPKLKELKAQKRE